ncbi:hypothetical protein PV10_05233 [Exophiala mesophila]|uniref:Uncharacterized protein n=1 Tax=Exophiala mesophila TaxID=212818 RepID=A0A0D1ZHJ3_EXOME|nr:uncharacterized protein PV10_05233 [Exophiala mesophila]KIV94077.1 hypothetical protein PV10_05233 [Exophiala mesophila]
MRERNRCWIREAPMSQTQNTSVATNGTRREVLITRRDPLAGSELDVGHSQVSYEKSRLPNDGFFTRHAVCSGRLLCACLESDVSKFLSNSFLYLYPALLDSSLVKRASQRQL